MQGEIIKIMSVTLQKYKKTDRVKTKKTFFGKSEMREAILHLEKEMTKMPDALIGDNDLCPLTHTFADGMYVREIFIPKGTAIVGKIHKHSHPNFLQSGEVTVFTEEGGLERIKAPRSIISPAGTKRVVYAHQDTVWITVHSNPYNITDLDKLEDMIISKNYLEYEMSKKQITDDSIKNCGLIALRNMTDFKNTSFKTLISLAKDNGLTLYPYKVSSDKLFDVPLPAIFHTEGHFAYISHKDEIKKIKCTGNVLCQGIAKFTKIKNSELNKITGGTWVAIAVGGIGLATTVVGGGLSSRARKLEARGKILVEKEKRKQIIEQRKIELNKEIARNKKEANIWIISGAAIIILSAGAAIIIQTKKSK